MSSGSGSRYGRLAPNHVPETVSNGNKFIKFDNDSSVGVPVTLWVDPKGYILYWKDQNKEMDCIDMSCIRDTRTGRYAHLPKDVRLKETINMGVKDCALEDKIVTVCYGTDMVNISFVNFSAISKEIAKEWTDVIFKCATNLLALNGSTMQFLEKCYTKLTLVRDIEGKIPVRNIIKMFAQNKEDRKRIQQVLETVHLPSGTNDKLMTLTFDEFFCFYHQLCDRHDVDSIFRHLKKQELHLTAEQFMRFLNAEQRDSRLNEILYPYCDLKKAQAIIEQHECDQALAKTGQLSREGFLRYLMSQENAIIPFEKLDLCHDMSQPLSHYFVNSSHNTYLTGHQLTGKSSVEIYRQVLLTGCRCVELDCWDGRGTDEEPTITHGYTMCTEVPFKEVLEAIHESAFKVSDYPVILSFENHCSGKQQAKMALYCRNVFGDALLADPLDTHKLEPDIPLPSPESLKRKILVKNKKRHLKSSHSRANGHPTNSSVSPQSNLLSPQQHAAAQAVPSGSASEGSSESGGRSDPDGEKRFDYETDSESEVESDKEASEMTEEEVKKMEVAKQEKGTTGLEVKAEMELSSLVNYIQPIHFHTFDHSEKRNRSYECTSFVETQATGLLKSFPVDFVNFNKRQLSRVYPKGTRVDSSNYMPQMFWNAGCQMVALNFQTLDLPMQLNLGLFEYNGRSGYVTKPDFMKRKDRQFDPFAESTVDGIVAGTLKVKIISGQSITDKKVGIYVEVEMYGLPADTVRRKFRTKICPGNGLNPMFDEEPFVFPKVILPNLAMLRIAVYQENGTTLLGHRVLPVESLRPGYRHIGLRNECNQPQGLATLFVHITVKDFVPDALSEFANALCNPIAYESAQEKRSHRLAIFEMDCDFEQSDAASLGSKSNSGSESAGFVGEKRGSEPAVKNPVTLKTSESMSKSRDAVFKYATLDNPGKYRGRCTSVDSNSGNMPQLSISISSLQFDASFGPVSLESFKQTKQYQKLFTRYQKEMEALQLKNEKIRTGKLHQPQTATFTSYADEFATEEEKKPKELKKKLDPTLFALFKQLRKSELDTALTFQLQLSTLLQRMVASERDSRLDDVIKEHKQEVSKYKKKQDSQNWEEMKALAKKIKDKSELSRVRREAMQKNIKASVQDRQKLKEDLEERISKVNAKYNEVFEQIKKERMQNEKKLLSSYDEDSASDFVTYSKTPPHDEANSDESSEAEAEILRQMKTVQVTEFVSTRL